MKKLLSVLLASTMALSVAGGLAACGDGDDRNTIKIWAPAASISGYKALINGFKEENPDYKKYTFKFENKEENDVQGALSDPKAGAHVFFFPSDHLNNLAYKLKCLQPLPETYVAAVTARDSKETVDLVTKNYDGTKDQIYAFPATDDNGYFLWYDSSKIGATDIATWDSLIAAAKAKNSKVMFNYGDSYYAPSFFFGAGVTFDYTDDTLEEYDTNVDSAEGIAAAGAYIKYFSSSYIGTGDKAVIVDKNPTSALAEAFANGSIVAGVGGTWVAPSVKKAMGDRYSNIKTAKLPSFTNGNNTYNMGSFIGGKYCGVNAAKPAEQIEVALAFANYLTGEVGQQARYDSTGAGPTNKVVAATDAVVNDPILATYRAQKESCGYPQKDQPSTFWEGINAFVKEIVGGKTTATNVGTKLEKLAKSMRG